MYVLESVFKLARKDAFYIHFRAVFCTCYKIVIF
jgi:hypothetical protein